jgi:tetratricopeptide (TPR) repeat protein
LGKILGEGGMGTVYRATDRLTGEYVALKRVTAPLQELFFQARAGHDSLQVALTHEFQTLASLRHPNIISVLDYGFDPERKPFFTMELVEDAQTIIEAGQTRSVRQKIDLIIQVLQALVYLHRRGVLHRDLKPQNVLVHDDNVKIVDFGLAIGTKPEPGMRGTLTYMAPEIMRRQAPSSASDLYSVGVIAYELLTGEHPYGGRSLTELFPAVFSEGADFSKLPAMDTLYADAEPDPMLTAVMMRLLALDPNARYQEAFTVIKELAMALGQPSPQDAGAIRESFLQAAEFVGRDSELESLINALHDTIQGNGSAWLIGGESGVGKSRLLDELRTHALVEGALVMRGQAISEGGTPLYLWREPMQRLILSVQLSLIDASILKAIVPKIADLMGHTVTISHDKLQNLPDAPKLDADAANERLLDAITSTFRQYQRPAVLILEDLHWAGPSIEVLKRLTPLVIDMPLLIVGSYRNDESPNLPDELPNMRPLKLKRLDKESIRTLSQSMLGDTGQQEDVIELLHRETEGNVFFVVEVVRALAEEAGRLEDVGRATLPMRVFTGGIQSILTRRLDRVAEWARPMLDLAAIAGREVDVHVLENVLNRSALWLDTEKPPNIGARYRINPIVRPLPKGNSITNWLLACADSAVLEVSEGRWRFAHDKLREAVQAMLPPSLLPRLYAQLADALERTYPGANERSATLAYYWRIAGVPEKEHYSAWKAGEYAAENSNYPDAIRYFERAHELLPAAMSDLHDKWEPMIEATLLVKLGDIYDDISDYPLAERHFKDALSLANKIEDKGLIAHAQYGVGMIDRRFDRYDDAIKNLQESLDVARTIGDRHGEVRALNALGGVYSDLDRFEDTITVYQEALLIAQDVGDHRFESTCLGNLGLAYSNTSKFEEALAYFQQALPIARESGYRRGESNILNNLAVTYFRLSRHEAAIEYYEQSLGICRDIGNRRTEGGILSNLAIASMVLGRHEEAIDYLQRGLVISRAIGNQRSEGVQLGNLANSYLQLGMVEDAIDYYSQALAIARQINNQRSEGIHLNNLGIAYLQLGQTDTAITHFSQSLKIAKQVNNQRGESAAYDELSTAYLTLGRIEEAIEYGKAAVEISQTIGATAIECEQRATLGWAYLADDKVKEACDVLTVAVEMDEPAVMRPLVALGAAYLRSPESSDVDNAKAAFEKAVQRAQDMIHTTPDNFDAWYTLGLAQAGLYVLGETNVGRVVASYVNARHIAPHVGLLRQARFKFDVMSKGLSAKAEPILRILTVHS